MITFTARYQQQIKIHHNKNHNYTTIIVVVTGLHKSGLLCGVKKK